MVPVLGTQHQNQNNSGIRDGARSWPAGPPEPSRRRPLPTPQSYYRANFEQTGHILKETHRLCYADSSFSLLILHNSLIIGGERFVWGSVKYEKSTNTLVWKEAPRGLLFLCFVLFLVLFLV